MNSIRHHRAVRGPALRAGLARIVAAVILAGTLVTACDVHGISAPGTIASLSITPNPKTLAIGATQQFVAVGTDAEGRKCRVDFHDFRWWKEPVGVEGDQEGTAVEAGKCLR